MLDVRNIVALNTFEGLKQQEQKHFYLSRPLYQILAHLTLLKIVDS